MNVLAVDSGLDGACAVLNERGDLVACFDLPVVIGEQRCIDAASLAGFVREHAPYEFAIIEYATAYPGAGAKMIRIGQTYGTIIGVLGALAIPLRQAVAWRWKKALDLNGGEDMLRERAIAKWPGKAGLFIRKKDHSRASACLLALYSLRNAG